MTNYTAEWFFNFHRLYLICVSDIMNNCSIRYQVSTLGSIGWNSGIWVHLNGILNPGRSGGLILTQLIFSRVRRPTPHFQRGSNLICQIKCGSGSNSTIGKNSAFILPKSSLHLEITAPPPTQISDRIKVSDNNLSMPRTFSPRKSTHYFFKHNIIYLEHFSTLTPNWLFEKWWDWELK